MLLRLWKALEELNGKEYLLTVVEAGDPDEALARVRAMHWPPTLGQLRVEEALAVGEPSPLRVRVGKLLVLDAGTIVQVAARDGVLRVVLAPATTLFDQLVAFLLRQPPPPADWQPSPSEECAAVARLAFRWGSYFAVIGDSEQPEWTEGISLGISRYNDREQARMSIEISANLEAIHRLREGEPATWRHLVYTARRLPGPMRTDETTTSAILHGRGWDGESSVLYNAEPAPRDPAFAGGLPVSPRTLEAFWRNPVRRILNVAALATWRVPMEEYHGDHRAPKQRPPLPLDKCRFTAVELAAVETIMARASNGVLHTLDRLQALTATELEKFAVLAIGDEVGRRWSITERTRNVLLY